MGLEEAAAGVRVTFAFAIAAPEGSVTCPRNAPEPGCAAPVCETPVCETPACGVEDWAPKNVAQGNEQRTSINHRYFRRVIQYSNP
jgi:hypothetical protein